MKRKTVKSVACTVLTAFGLTMVPAPAMAESTNIVTETENVYVLTVPQIQQLAVIYNDTLDSLELSIEQLELQEQMTSKQRRKVNNQVQSVNSTNLSGANEGLAAMESAIAALQEQVAANPTDIALQANLMTLTAQYQSSASTLQSTAETLNSSFDQLVDAREQLDDALDDMEEGRDDLKEAVEELEDIMRYTSAKLALTIVQLDETVELMKKQLALLDKSIQVYELQQRLGMATSIDVKAQYNSRAEVANSLADLQEQRDMIKRSLNILIGRTADTPLDVVPMQLLGAITPAETFTPELAAKFVAINPQMESLLDDREDLKEIIEDDGDDMGSDEKQDIEYQIQAINLKLKTQREAAEDELKTMLSTINSNAETYRISIDTLELEQKNYAIAQKKYELGMISGMELQQAELILAQAELTYLSNGYQHYFDWQKYYLAEKGIDTSSLL